MLEARNKVKRLIYSMNWVDSIKLPEGGCNHDESKDDFSRGYVAGYYNDSAQKTPPVRKNARGSITIVSTKSRS